LEDGAAAEDFRDMSKGKIYRPEWSLRFLKWFCPDHLQEEIEGDLIEKYNQEVRKIGKLRAELRLIWNVARFFRLSIIARNKFDFLRNQNLMFRTNSKVIGRQIVRNKTFSIISTLGLTIGLTICLLIAQFVKFEQSFENYNENGSRTYRVNLYNTHNGVFDKISSGTVSGLAQAIKERVPGVESIARLGDKTTGIVSNRLSRMEDKESNIFFADSAIINMLAIDILDGDSKSALRTPQSVIISESAARKYFGDTHVSGKILEIGFSSATVDKQSFEVQGVFRDIPSNSNQRFDFVLYPANEKSWNENWAWSNVVTYVRLGQNVNPDDLEGGFSSIVNQHHVDGVGDRYLLEPITEIRLHALDGNGRASLINFFILLGAVILLLAWFNYINLSTARFFERMKEVGIRKLIGASRSQLVLQLLTESFFFNLISFFVALLLFFMSWPFVTQFLEQPMPITLFNDRMAFVYVATFIVASSLFAGFYPAFFLSSFKPLQSLRGKLTNFVDRSTLRKVFVVCQFSVSIILISGVLAIRNQIEYMRSQDLGISIDQTLIIEEPLLTDATSLEKYEVLKSEILQMPNVNGVTYASSFPGTEIDWHRTDITLGRENADYKYNSRIIAIGTEFVDVFGLTLMAGRNFNPMIESDAKAMLISEAASKMFGFADYDEALGHLIFVGSRRFEVIGVLKNYHFRSLQQGVQPLLYMQGYPRGPRYAIKISRQGISETISGIESQWKKAYPSNVFRYYFLDDFFDKQYNEDQKTATSVSLLAIVAVFISCSGLFALSLYSVNGRTKEISIRKVFGASVSSVVMLLSRDFVKLVIIGGIIALPFTHQLTKLWLEGYAYKMEFDASLFLVPLTGVIALALITISFQTFSAANRNPVQSMKYE
jgi:putative ABC transport system permease protein